MLVRQENFTKWYNERSYCLKLKKSLMALTLSVILLTACGSTLLATFRAGVASSKPFVSSLVASGAISQGKADTVIKDINDGITVASVGEQCITSAPGDKKIAKAKCYFQVAQGLRAILERHNIGGNSKLDQIAGIVEGAIAAFEEFFRNTTGGQNSITAGRTVDPEKVLEGKMKAFKVQMDAVTGQ